MSTVAETKVRERSIIMTGESVRAILSGSKTQTRRVVTDATSEGNHPASCLLLNDPRTFVDRGFGDRQYLHAPVDCAALAKRYGWAPGDCDPSVIERLYPRWSVGERLWVRETWVGGDPATPSGMGIIPRRVVSPTSKIVYAASSDYGMDPPPWRSPIHMPRWASRLTLEVTDVRVERLQQVTRDDALSEGIERHDDDGVWYYGPFGKGHCDPIAAFGIAWDVVNRKRAPWSLNPWVFVLHFVIAAPRSRPSP